MANRKKEVYKPKPMTEGKRNIIQGLLQEYDIETADDIQDALKDLLSGTLKEMMESVLNSLKNRGVQDILILCSDGLTGMKDAIATAFPMTEQQRCIVHMVRNTLKYVANKDMKAFAKDLKTIYTSPDEKNALKQLETVTEKWTMPIRNWGKVRGELTIMYPDRMPD